MALRRVRVVRMGQQASPLISAVSSFADRRGSARVTSWPSVASATTSLPSALRVAALKGGGLGGGCWEGRHKLPNEDPIRKGGERQPPAPPAPLGRRIYHRKPQVKMRRSR